MFACFSLEDLQPIRPWEGDAVAPMLALIDQEGVRHERDGERAADGWTVGDAIDAYLDASEASEGTRLSYATTRRRWAEWSKQHRSPTPMLFSSVTADDVQAWLDWCLAEARSAGDNNADNTYNKRRRELHAVYQWAAKRRKISAVPAFPEDRDQRTVAGHYFLTDDEIERLYWATYKLERPRGWKERQPIGAFWRAAIVVLRTYGFDTQILFPYTARAVSVLRWRCLSSDALPPGRLANVSCSDGWIVVRRQKTGRNLILPLVPVVRAHLELLRPAVADPNAAVFARAGGMRPCRRFQELCELAKLTDKWDPESAAIKSWELKDLRKTCATAHNANKPGSAQYVLGHSSGVITDTHYANVIPLVLDAVRSLPQPRAFHAVLDESIRPPPGAEVLFAM